MLDYSAYRLKMHQLDREMHKQLLKRDYQAALDTAYQVMAEQKLVINAIKELMSQDR